MIENLVPADAVFNTRTNGDKMPTDDLLMGAVPRLVAYRNYQTAPDLAPALERDALGRFSTLHQSDVVVANNALSDSGGERRD